MAVPMGKIESCYGTNSIFQPEIRRQGFRRQIAFRRYQVMDEVDSSPIAGILRKYRRDIACFIMAILAVLFCASEWFRVQGAFGQVLHAMASGLFGLTSVILPVFLALVVFSLMRKTQNKDENLHMALGWFMILWSVCSILDAAIASDSQKFDMSLLQRAGGLLGYVLGCPLAWGLSKGFSIAIFVVVILFSLLLITHTRVTQIPDKAKALAAKFVGTPKNRDDIDDEAEQFPNEVRVGGTTLAFAEGVPAHDGTDADGENDDRPGFLTRMKQRFASHKSKNVDDGDLDHYAGDEAFLNAAERHGQTAETIVDEPYQQVDSPRSISSDDYRADDYDSDDYSAAAPSGTTAMPQNGRGRSFSSAPIGTASGTMPSVAEPVRPAKSSRLASLQTTHGPSSTRTAPPMARKSWWMPRPARSLTICRLLPLTGKRRMTFPRDRIICLTSTF